MYLTSCHRASNELLEKENHMFETFFKENGPQRLSTERCILHRLASMSAYYICVYMSVAVPTTHSSQLDVQKKKVRIREGASSSARYIALSCTAFHRLVKTHNHILVYFN